MLKPRFIGLGYSSSSAPSTISIVSPPSSSAPTTAIVSPTSSAAITSSKIPKQILNWFRYSSPSKPAQLHTGSLPSRPSGLKLSDAVALVTLIVMCVLQSVLAFIVNIGDVTTDKLEHAVKIIAFANWLFASIFFLPAICWLLVPIKFGMGDYLIVTSTFITWL